MSTRTLELTNGVEELSDLLPKWLSPCYFLIVIALALLAAIISSGQAYISALGSTAKSTICLIALDCLTSFSLILCTLLLMVASLTTDPLNAISPAFIAPMSAFIGACIYAHSAKPQESRILTLWLRVSSMTIVNKMRIHQEALFAALHRCGQPATIEHTPNEDEIIDLVRADSPGGLSAAAENKGSRRPFLQILRMWWQQGTAQHVPRIWIRRRINNTLSWRLCSRTVTHAVAIQRLVESGRCILDAHNSGRTPLLGDESDGCVKVMSSFNHVSRHVVHARYGNIWMRAAGQPGLDKSNDAWWLIGCEIVQSLKAAVGVEFLSSPIRYANVIAMWDWIELLGFGFRRDMQIKPVAEEIAKMNAQDPIYCVNEAYKLANNEKSDGDEHVMQIAREANIVACVGLGVKACEKKLGYMVGDFNKAAVKILERSDARFGRDKEGHANIAVMEENRWPEHALSVMIVEWVSDGCRRMNLPGAPIPL